MSRNVNKWCRFNIACIETAGLREKGCLKCIQSNLRKPTHMLHRPVQSVENKPTILYILLCMAMLSISQINIHGYMFILTCMFVHLFVCK